MYETDHLQQWEDRFFWGARRKRTRKSSLAGEVLFDEALDDGDETAAKSGVEEFEEVKPLAEELIDTLIDLVSGKPSEEYAESMFRTDLECIALLRRLYSSKAAEQQE